MVYNDETLANSMKQCTEQGGKRRNKERGPNSKPKKHNLEWVTKGQWNKSCSKTPTNCKKHMKKKKGWKLERAISIEKPSPTTCLKIEAT
jgi:hypothetical protein